MASSTCCFCSHANPPKAKFCNECASPLHLKPCRLCDAVNARDAQACHRCGAALQAAPETLDASPDHIVSEADETLAALRRELVATTAPDAETSSESIRDGVGEVVADTSAAVDARAAEPASTVQEEELDRQDAFAESGAGDEQRPGMEARVEAIPPEPAFEISSVPVRPEERQGRPERRSRGLGVAIVIALVAVPLGVYLMRNPAQLDEWLGRTAAPPTIEPTAADAPPVAPPVAVPTEPAATLPAASSAPAESSSDAATLAQRAQQAVGGVVTLLPPSPPVEPDASISDTPTSVVVAPDREAKTAPASRARTSAARTRSRERATKPRPQTPPAQSQRDTAQPPDQSRTQPCTEAVAALGLCNR
jgi:hypothetical protein